MIDLASLSSRRGIVLLLPLFVAAALLPGCVDPLDLDVPGERRRLVVDGLVTDQPGPYTVQLTYSAAYDNGAGGLSQNVRDADVRIEDDAGNAATLSEDGPGEYKTRPGDLRGEVGRSYTLFVETPEGESYRSAPELLLPVAPLDSIGLERAERSVLQNGATITEPGVEISINTADPAGTTDYYRWEWEGTFKVEHPIPPNTSDVCWVTERNIGTVRVSDDALIDGESVNDREVGFVPLSYKMFEGYYVETRQQSLTKRAYDFWSLVREQQEEGGTIFAPPPDRIRGNVENVDDPDRRALGYFGASAISERSMCFQVNDFPPRPQFPPVPEGPCNQVYDGRFTGTTFTRIAPDFWVDACR